MLDGPNSVFAIFAPIHDGIVMGVFRAKDGI
jgi:hypothetical protein